VYTAGGYFRNVKAAMLAKRIRWRTAATVVPVGAGVFVQSQPAFNFLVNLLEYRVGKEIGRTVVQNIVHHKVPVVLTGCLDQFRAEGTEVTACINMYEEYAMAYSSYCMGQTSPSIVRVRRLVLASRSLTAP